jgi:DNA-binding Lrp family transcriptional regulator
LSGTVLRTVTSAIDDLDARLIAALASTPRAPVLDLARRLGVARGTVQARLDKLQQRGVITGFGPDLSARALGYGVVAFTMIEIAQGRLADVVDHLRAIPEVLEAHGTTGPGDLHCRLVARSNEHLQEVINRVLDVQGIVRTETHVALSEQIALRLVPLAQRAARPG